MNIFNSLRLFAGKWSVSSSTKFNAEEIASVNRAVVVDSQYGPSVCFFLKTGEQAYIPVAQDSTLGVGEVVDLTKVEVLTLSKSGEADILRVK